MILSVLPTLQIENKHWNVNLHRSICVSSRVCASRERGSVLYNHEKCRLVEIHIVKALDIVEIQSVTILKCILLHFAVCYGVECSRCSHGLCIQMEDPFVVLHGPRFPAS